MDFGSTVNCFNPLGHLALQSDCGKQPKSSRSRRAVTSGLRPLAFSCSTGQPRPCFVVRNLTLTSVYLEVTLQMSMHSEVVRGRGTR